MDFAAILNLRHLSHLEREVLIEAAIRDQTNEEIAVTVGISRQCVRDTKARALRRMRKLLTQPSP